MLMWLNRMGREMVLMFLVKTMREIQQSGQKVHYIDNCGFKPMAGAEACYYPGKTYDITDTRYRALLHSLCSSHHFGHSRLGPS